MENLAFSKIWILIVIVIVLIGGIFFLQKGPETSKEETKQIKTTEEEISDWKIYQDSKRGFLIKYPPNWKDPDEFGMNVYFGNEDVQIRTAGVLTLSSVRTFGGEVSEREELIKSWPEMSGLKKEDILLNNIPGIRLSYIDTKQNLIKNIVFLKKEDSAEKRDIICEIEVTIFNEKDSYLPLVDRMLSTFQFLK